MEFPNNPFNLPVPTRNYQRRGWVCVTLVVFFVVQFLGDIGGSESSKVFQRRWRRFTTQRQLGTTNDAAAEAEVSVSRDEPQVNLDDTRRSRHDAECLALAQSTVAVLQTFFPDEFLSPITGAEVQHCEETGIPGLEAVTFFLSLLSPGGNGGRTLEDVFPSADPVALMSARRGKVANYRIKNDAHCPSIKEENGPSFTVTSVNSLHGSQLQKNKIEAFFNGLKAELRLHQTFNVDSLKTVECRFRLKTILDVLVRPAPELRAPCSENFFANCFLLYSEAEVTLLQLADIIYKNAESSPEMRRQAKRARLHLSLQLVDVVGRIRIKRVVLPPFSLEQIHVDRFGTLYIHPTSAPLRELAALTYGTWQQSGITRTAEDTAVALVYIWCPLQAQALLLSTKTFTQKNVLAAVTPARCPSMQETVRTLLSDILSETQNLDEVRYVSESYKHVEALLQQELQKQRKTKT